MRSSEPTQKRRTVSSIALLNAWPPCPCPPRRRLRSSLSAMHSRVAGTGGYLPAQVVTNADLERRIETSDAWVQSRTGIRQRHVAADDECTSDLALAAAREALAAAQIAASDVDLIVVATTTPDMIFPSTACILQAK